MCEVKHSWSNLSFRGVCTLVSWVVWSVQWEAVHVITTDSKIHYDAEVGYVWSLSTRAYDCWSIKSAWSCQQQLVCPNLLVWWGQSQCEEGSAAPLISPLSHLHDAVVILLLVLNFSELFSRVTEKLLTLAASDCVSVMNGVCTDSLLVKCFGSLPSERLCIRMREAEVWITVLASLTKLPVPRLRGLNSKLFRFFSMGLWRTAAIFHVSSYEEVAHIRL